MKFEQVDRLPLLAQGPWSATVARWKLEGMKDLEVEFSDYDAPMQNCWLYGEFQGPIPKYEAKVFFENEEYIDVRNATGQIERRLKTGLSMPHFLEYPVRSRSDWLEIRKRFNPLSPGRYPANWNHLVMERNTPGTKAFDDVRGVAVWGFYGFPREMMGPERLSYMFYDDPALVEEMNEFWLDFTIRRLEKAVKEMTFDYALIWEDNCYNHGLLHSPAVFKRFMAPHYRKLVDFFVKHDFEVISVDSDGNVQELIPLLLDIGVTGMHPFEVAAGMDIVTIGREYPGLQIWGGIDKRCLADGPAAIERELKRVVLPMKTRGGYAAGLDHGIPSDVSLENHRCYTRRLMELSVVPETISAVRVTP